MEIGEIIKDALTYPFNNIKSLLIYLVLGIIAGIATGGTLVGIITGVQNNNALASGLGIIGFIIAIVIFLLITGYELDIVKYGINRDPSAPGIDITRQVSNAIKLIIVDLIYFIVPIIVAALLGFLLGNGILTLIIVLLITILFGFAELMGRCRLANTDQLGDALAIGEAIGDISRVGILKIIATVLCMLIITVIVGFIIVFITQWNATVGGILLGIFGIYLAFFVNRAAGLLYSDV